MTNTPNIHWTHDAELLEQFVLHRVDEARRKELEAHLLTCEECQNAVREEQQLVLGIKRVGRDEMKSRLKERLQTAAAQPAQRNVPWVRIVSIAATFVIVFGLGIYNKWIPLGSEEPVGVSEQELQKQAGAVDEAENKDEQPPAADDARSGEVAAQPRPEAPKAETLARRETESAREKKVQQEADRDRRIADAPAPSAAGAAAKQYDAKADELVKKEAFEDNVMRQQVWVDGVVISGKQSVDAYNRVSPNEPRLRAVPQTQQGLAQKANTAAVTVIELPLEELPRTQQTKQQRLDQNTVQTLIEQQNGNLNFTLYRQAPQQKLKQLTQNAVLEQVSPDSIVITIDGEQIGYKIRGGLDALQQNQQTKTKK